MKFSAKRYGLTLYQRELLKTEQIHGRLNIKNHLENVMNKHILIETGLVNGQKDYLVEEDLNYNLIEYILNTSSVSYGKAINKYNVSNYYAQLSRYFSEIAKARKISRNNLWHIIKGNIIIKNYNTTYQRLYKNIFRGEIIPSPKFVYNLLQENDDLPSYLSLVYLDEVIVP